MERKYSSNKVEIKRAIAMCMILANLIMTVLLGLRV